jgi:hypothetical protein
MGRFHGPNTLFEPIEQQQIVSRAAKESLAKVHVSLHKAGKNCATRSIDNEVSRRASFTEALDAALIDQQITAYDRVVSVHRQKYSAFNENRFHSKTGIPIGIL